MKSCIIGGSGFIGRHLVDDLLQTGRNVITVGRSPFDYKNIRHHQVQTLFDNEVTNIINDHVDEVVYLAYTTKPKTSFDNPVRDIEENLAQAVHLFETVAAAKTVKKLVYVSSGGTVYGHTEDDIIAEDHSKHPISPYGITKLTMEQYAYMFFTIYHLPVVIVRPSNAYGVGQMAREGQGFIAYAMQSVLHHKPINIYGETGTVRDYIYVSDVAAAIRFCLDKAAAGSIYNIGSGRGYTNTDVVHILQTIVDTKKYDVKIAHSPLRPFDVNRNVLDCTAIERDTGWKPLISLQEGLSLTWDWFNNYYPE